MTEGTISSWEKKVGDEVDEVNFFVKTRSTTDFIHLDFFKKQGDILASIQTDKAEVDFETMDSGVLAKVFVEAGTTVNVGTPIGIMV